MTVSSRGTTRTLVAGTAQLALTVTGTYPSGTGSGIVAGDLLVAIVTAYGSTSLSAAIATATAGWTEQVTETASTTNQTAIFTKIAAGSDAAPVFTATATGTAAACHITVTIYDLFDSSGGTPSVSTTGINTGTASPVAVTVGTGDTLVYAGSYALIAGQVSSGTTSNTSTWTTPASWSAGTSQTTTSTAATANFFYAAPPTGYSFSASLAWTHTSATQFSAVLLVAQPPAAAKTAALTDAFFTDDLATVWTWSTAGTYAPVISGGRCQMSTGNTANEYNSLAMPNLYDLTGSAFFARIVAPADVSNVAMLCLALSGSSGDATTHIESGYRRLHVRLHR